MTRHERKLLVQTALVGTGLTLLVSLALVLGGLRPLERWLYDQRARDNQRFMPPPTDKLLHLDIDDRSLDTIGRWPWKRSVLARVIDEVHDAGAKAIALDIILPEPQEPELVEVAPGQVRLIDHDALLAESFARAGNVLLPVSFKITARQPRAYYDLVDILLRDLELDDAEARRELQVLHDPLPETFDADYFAARREAMYLRVSRRLEQGAVTLAELRAELLPRTGSLITDSPQLRLLEAQLRKAQAMRALLAHARYHTQEMPPLTDATDELPPVLVLSRAAAATAFVDFMPDDDKVVRSVPLWIVHRNRVYPQFGLTLACMVLDVDPRDLLIERDRLVIPLPDAAPIVIPVDTRFSTDLKHNVGQLMDIPWRGPSQEWNYMYDPQGKQTRLHLPLTRVWESFTTGDRIIANNANLDDALRNLLHSLDAYFETAKLAEFAALAAAADDFPARRPFIDWVMAQLDEAGWLEGIDDLAPADLPEDERRLIAAINALRELAPQTEALVRQRQTVRAELRAKMQGRGVIVGWTATAVAADFVGTSLHFKCPGPVIHGAVFNGILTRELWTRAPEWVSLLATLLIGLMVAAIVALLSPLRSLLAALVLGVAYFVGNGVLLFDYLNLIVGVAGPVVAVAVVWSGGILFRFIQERRERQRVTSRFRSYVDPALVDYVLADPGRAKLDGQLRELTVVFTDLAGFTTLSEKLREGTVPILNEYMQLMVPIIREHRGYVNKFLGDGIMFFYGAPRDNSFHTIDAVLTALKMQHALVDFNRGLTERNLPNVKMRVGISTGPMVVGDAGPIDAHDYTVLGDTVNLGARLESANKATGTWILINDQAALLTDNKFLLRPVGRLQVVGKSQGVMTFEPLCLAENASPDQKALAELCNTMVNAFVASDFAACIAAAEQLDQRFGPAKLTELYLRISRRYLQTPPDADFVGQIVLEEK